MIAKWAQEDVETSYNLLNNNNNNNNNNITPATRFGPIFRAIFRLIFDQLGVN
jgi:hypothetical protein